MNAFVGQKAAFFDVDGTLINSKSMVSFLEFQKEAVTVRVEKINIYLDAIYQGFKNNIPRENLNRFYYGVFKDVSVKSVEDDAARWFAKMISDFNFFNAPLINRARELKANNYRLVLVSGSFHTLLEQLKEHVPYDDVLCSVPEIVNDRYTGELLGQPCIGVNKKHAIIRYALDNTIDLQESYGFGDDDSDDFMLETVGYGIKVTSDNA